MSEPRWVTVTMDDVIPDWGEGHTMAEARAHLLKSVVDKFRDLRSADVRGKLGSHLHDEYEWMEELRQALSAVTDESP